MAAGATSAEVFVADMSNATDCQNLVLEAFKKFGGIDTIILNHVRIERFL